MSQVLHASEVQMGLLMVQKVTVWLQTEKPIAACQRDFLRSIIAVLSETFIEIWGKMRVSQV